MARGIFPIKKTMRLAPYAIPWRPGVTSTAWPCISRLLLAATPSPQSLPHTPSPLLPSWDKASKYQVTSESTHQCNAHENVTQREWRFSGQVGHPWSSWPALGPPPGEAPWGSCREHYAESTEDGDQVPAKPPDSDVGPVTKSFELVRRCSMCNKPAGTLCL